MDPSMKQKEADLFKLAERPIFNGQHSWGLSVCLLHNASGHSNVLKAGKAAFPSVAEELKNARKRRTARKANKLRARLKGYKNSSG